MAKQYGRALATFNYARRIKKIRPGQVRVLRFHGKQVRVLLEPNGKQLKVLDAPKDVINVIRRAETLRIVDGKIQPVLEKQVKTKAAQPQKQEFKPKTESKAEREAEVVAERSPQKAEEKTEEVATIKPPKPQGKPKALGEDERRKAMLVPVPDKGPIPTPYINWDSIPETCRVSGVTYYDYPTPQAPNGMLHELRTMFRRNRLFQDKLPVNVIIKGPPGTGKSELIKKFAEETGLPYWQVIGEEGLRADELLGHWELREGSTKWVDGIIPKAVRSGGILHIDEPNVIEPSILMRLDELLDNKRQLNMENLNGEIIKAHPDLFIIFTMNPPTYEGVKELPKAIKSRLTKRYDLNYPPLEVELSILKRKMGLSDSEFKPPTRQSPASGKYARDIMDLMKIINNLRKEQDLSYVPSMRETQAFLLDLMDGDSFHKAFDANIKAIYWGDEEDRIEEALRAVRPRSS